MTPREPFDPFTGRRYTEPADPWPVAAFLLDCAAILAMPVIVALLFTL